MLEYFQQFSVQNFLFRATLLNYLIKNVNGQLLKKLHKTCLSNCPLTCKYFYIKLPYIILDLLLYLNNILSPQDKPILEIIFNQKYENNNKKVSSIVEEGNLWIIQGVSISTDTSPPSIISKIIKCDVWSLSIGIDITFEELKFLTCHGRIKQFDVHSKIYLSNNNLAPPEDIISLVPQAYEILMFSFNYSDQTMQKLLTLNHSVKLKNLMWHDIEEWININLLCQFLEKFLASDTPYFSIVYKDLEMRNAFKFEICDKIEKWEPAERKPQNFPYVYCARAPSS